MSGEQENLSLSSNSPQHVNNADLRKRAVKGRLRQLLAKRRRQSGNSVPPVDLLLHYEREKALRERVLTNAAPLASLATFIFVVLKVLLVSDSNVSTALAVIKEAGVLQVAAGALIVGIPLLGTGLVNAAGIFARSEQLNRFEKRRLWYYYFSGSFALSFVVPWSTMAIIVGFPLVTWLLNKRKERALIRKTPVKEILNGRPSDVRLQELQDEVQRIDSELRYLSSRIDVDVERRDALATSLDLALKEYSDRSRHIEEAGGGRLDVLAIGLILTTVTPLLYLSLTSTPWLAAEKITLNSNEIVIGYVLTTKDDWATILLDKPRLVRTLPADEIRERETCVKTDDSNARQTLWNLPKGDLHSYPRCPSGP